jgi:hypothetical protein
MKLESNQTRGGQTLRSFIEISLEGCQIVAGGLRYAPTTGDFRPNPPGLKLWLYAVPILQAD